MDFYNNEEKKKIEPLYQCDLNLFFEYFICGEIKQKLKLLLKLRFGCLFLPWVRTPDLLFFRARILAGSVGEPVLGSRILYKNLKKQRLILKCCFLTFKEPRHGSR